MAESISSFKRQAASDQAAKVRHHADGGRADAAADKKLVVKAIRQHENAEHDGKHSKLHLATGGKAMPRMDRPGYAKGGRTKHGAKTHVNVIVAPQGGGGGPGPGAAPPMMPHPPMAPPAPPPGAPPMAPPRPPMAGPPVGAGVPPMMHAAGGAVKGTKDGAGGGLGRLEKIKMYGKKMPQAEQD